MLDHFDRHQVLTNVNHGFRAGYSCETQLVYARSFNKGLKVDIAILDFSKAFDTIPQDCQLHKLRVLWCQRPTASVDGRLLGVPER